MFSKVKSCCLFGIDGFIVDVEVDISNGIPVFDIVGLADTAVRESKERVKSAIKNSKINFPIKRITVNLAPANIKKAGSQFDLPIAISILVASGVVEENKIKDSMFIGELSLDGRLKPVRGILPMALCAKKNNYKSIIVPYDNADEAAIVEGIEVKPAKCINDIVDMFNGDVLIENHQIENDRIFKENVKHRIDFSDVKGQSNVKRAVEISVAGGHNILLIGSPGAGKTMIAKRISTILPNMTFEEAIEVTKIYSVVGKLPEGKPIVSRRPFRNPHHTISNVGLIGGGRYPMPGEISLAHNGVLYLDELPEFSREALEAMRQPLEDASVVVSRLTGTVNYPANVTLVCSANPCKCGYYFEGNRCECSQKQVKQYMSKISGPLLDRIDIQVEVMPVKYSDMYVEENTENSNGIRKRVEHVRKIQMERYKKYGIVTNSQLTSDAKNKFCKLDDFSRQLIKSAFEKLGLSARALDKIVKIARTIADMENSEQIKSEHVAEAIQYRSFDRLR